MEKINILIVDDEKSQVMGLKSYLQRRNYNTIAAYSGEEALKTAKTELVDIVLTDVRMPGMDGMELLKNLKKANPEIDVIVMTAYSSVEDAVEIMKAGAYDYMSKPVDLDELEIKLTRLSERRALISENKTLKKDLREKFGTENIIYRSPKMEEALNTAARVAVTKATVLIRGESGTGKELFAKAIHYGSPRSGKPFVTVNAASLPENLLESELFGHEKGAFTGAFSRRAGRFEEADGGTLFIDEVGDIPLPVQVKLLRAVQFGEVQRLGSNETVKTDVRLIAATHQNLERMIKEGTFREDLYYRLNVVSITVPPLRERKDDIPLLTNYLIKKHAAALGRDIEGLSREALDRLMKYSYPGNVRELENIIERGVALARGNLLETKDLPQEENILNGSPKGVLDPKDLSAGYEEKVREFESAMIEEALFQSGGNQSAAARLLGISERHLRSRLERLGMKHNN